MCRRMLIASIGLSSVVHKEIIDGPYFQNAVETTSESLCKNWERQCANRESVTLSKVRQSKKTRRSTGKFNSNGTEAG